MAQSLRIVALQPPLRSQQPMPNMITLRHSVDELPASADLVVLPESWSGLPPDHPEVDEHAGQSTQFLQTLARSRNVWVVGGTLERRRPGGGVRRVCLIVDRSGNIAGEYSKRVLFGHEQELYEPGDGPGIFDVEGVRVAVLICADLWHPELARELCGRADLLCVPCKTTVPTDEHVLYARGLWHSLALTRAFENGLPVVVSDWASGRHRPVDVDRSTGSVHAAGTTFDRGVLYKRHRDAMTSPTASGPVAPTAIPTTSAEPALAPGVYFTAGASSICNPAHRPDLQRIHRVIERGAAGFLYGETDWPALTRFREYRRRAGLLPATVLSPTMTAPCLPPAIAGLTRLPD